MKYLSLSIILIIGICSYSCQKKKRYLECDKGYDDVADQYTPPVDISSMHLSRSDAAVIRSDSDFYSVFLDTSIAVDVDWSKNSLIGTSVYTPYEIRKQGSSLCVDHDEQEYILSVYLTTKKSKSDSNVVDAWFLVPVVPSNYEVIYTKKG